MKIDFLFSPECPHVEPAWTLVQEVASRLAPDAELNRVEISTLEAAQERGFSGSPSVHIDGRDLEGPGREPSLSCRLYGDGAGVPPQWLLEAAILRALSPSGFLFMCVANSARSQLAEGIARSLAPASVRVFSAGSEPTQIRPEAVKVLRSMGLDPSGQHSKGVEAIDPEQVDTVITLCAEEVCPVYLGRAHRVHWGLPDPAREEGSPSDRLNAFFRTASELKKRLQVLWGADADAVRRDVSEFYAKAIENAAYGVDLISGRGGLVSSGCCGSSASGCCSGGSTAGLAGYDPLHLADLPGGLADTTFGCGDPVSVAGIEPGQTVLDLGCGAGLDLLLAAKKTGPGGRVIGVDMTPRMLDQARRNVEAAGLTNVELLEGTIENLPVADASVDWVISNCVINLSPEKPKVFAELFRVLRPGGSIRVSDICAEEMPVWAKNGVRLYASCIAGAVPVQVYLDGLTGAGLQQARALSMHVYSAEQLKQLIGTGEDSSEEGCDSGCCCGSSFSATLNDRIIRALSGKIATVVFIATRPV